MAFPSSHGHAGTRISPVFFAALRIAGFSGDELLENDQVDQGTGSKVQLSIQLVVDS